ncbi:MAG TPA: hypothetical protein VHF26_14090 [Trebonia sp.]|nr:hypothetical protein [Trebonia sp.]
MPRKSTPAVTAGSCPACDGTGETEQAPTRRRGTVRGQMGVCLTCLGTGLADTAPAAAPVARPHP